MEAVQWKVRGYEAAMNAYKDAKTDHEVEVKQEHVDVIRRFPAPAKEDIYLPRTMRLWDYCGLDHRVPTVCTAQGKI